VASRCPFISVDVVPAPTVGTVRQGIVNIPGMQGLHGGDSSGVVMRDFPEMPHGFITLSGFSAWLQGFRSR
jgi:hypothetical protein